MIARAQRGDRQAFEQLVRTHQRKVYSLALRMLGDQEDAEDVLQETFVSLYRNIGNFRGGSSLATYLYRLATNFSLMRLRQRRSRRQEQHISWDSDDQRPDPQAFSLEDLLEKEKRTILNRFLFELEPKTRAAVILGDIEGLPGLRAAKILGLSLSAYKSRLHRGRQTLRKKLLPYLHHQEPSND